MIFRNYWLPSFVFLVAFLLVPVSQLDGLKLMPGDIGDARLNNYFLENIYQFLFGHIDSLWNVKFFWPFPYVLGFSDNLFGASPIYIVSRFLTGQSDTAFQLWFFTGYFVNFWAVYYSLSKLGLSRYSACVGATIFAFALPVSAHASHAQLYYRFGVPLATTYFALFLSRKDWNLFAIASIWLVWQFFCGIYMGFFVLILMFAMLISHFVVTRYGNGTPVTASFQTLLSSLTHQSRRKNFNLLVCLIALLCLMLFLFYPYLQVTRLYGVNRSWDEISLMLPRLQSYLLADASSIWSFSESKIFSEIPMRHEHQMFFGGVSILLGLLGVIVGSRKNYGNTYVVISLSLAILFVITLYVGGVSLWYLFHKLPLASAIRAMTRIDLVLLFPVAYLASISIDYIQAHWRRSFKIVFFVIVLLLIFESSLIQMNASKKTEWRDRIAQKEAILPTQLNAGDVLFFAQNTGPFYADELDAMWVALRHGVDTLNGYSGSFPPGFSVEYGNDCSELPRRIVSYLDFSHQNSEERYLAMIKRIVPIGFANCDKRWFQAPPKITRMSVEHTVDQIRQLSYYFEGIERHNEKIIVKIRIDNDGSTPIGAISKIGKPIRISWRFLNEKGAPIGEWDTRKDLPFDIPAHGSISMNIQVNDKILNSADAMQISLVQEAVFWAHDIGVQPLTISLRPLLERP